MSPGDRLEVDGRYRRRDGTTFPVGVHVQRLDLGGEGRYVVISRDVTDRRRRERERKQIIDLVTDAIVKVDEEWRFTLVDQRAEELYRMSEASLVAGRRTLELALDELLTNVIVHNDRATPRVELSLSVRDETVEVTVVDDGPGLNQRDRRSLQRGIESPLEHTQGLGLWLVRWTLEKHGGEIDIADSDPRGTAITARLPLASV